VPLFGRCQSHFGLIQVIGGAPFRARTLEALELLCPYSCFEVVQAHVAVIQQGLRSGMKAWRNPPAFIVGKATWQHSAVWYAGAIAHEAHHSKLYLEAKRTTGEREPDANTWTGAAAEKQSLLFQRQVLIALGATPSTIAYIDDQLKNPTYQGRNTGLGAWLDYVKRWW
jgi:hypothetical protein